DHMMTSVGLPTGLIRYASEEEIADKKPFRFNSRLKAYSVVLFVLVTALTTLIAMRTDTDTTILRTPGMLYQTREDGRISNLYAIKTVNKTPNDMPLRLELMNVTGDLELVGNSLELKGGELGRSEAFIILAKDQLTGMKTNVVVGIYSGDELLEEVSTSFVGPITTGNK
ncbi:MAG TPA: FixG Ig-like domain-containing protein, partial [Flavobacteriales bacterium]|nr:FixG Ig-like domain-containing protein [Flavobacteriales bacterium]